MSLQGWTKRGALGLALLATGCGSGEPGGGQDVSTADTSAPTPVASKDFRPRAKVDGAWREADTCKQALPSAWLACALPDVGTLRVRQAQGAGPTSGWYVDLTLSRAAKVEALELTGPVKMAATCWWSQGFQSWSQSGALAIGPAVSDEALDKALKVRGDQEVMRQGPELSWWGTVVGGKTQTLVAMAETATVWRSWAQVRHDGDGVRVRLVSGGTGEQVAAQAGEVIAGERWTLALADDANQTLTQFGQGLRTGQLPPPEAGWNSWYQLWDAVDEATFRQNATLAATLLGPLAKLTGQPLRVVVDDGWQAAWGDWTTNAKFPSGLSKLVTDLKAQGLESGVWLAPLLVSEKLPVVAQHPEWFVGGAVYDHLKNGKMRVLDVTHPGAAQHLRGQIQALRDHGLTLLKIDFLFAGTWEGTRHQPVTGMQAYGQALDLIRQAAGPGVRLVAVGAPPLGTIGRVDAWRVGPDIALEPFGAAWAFLPAQLRTLSVRWPYCLAVACDADPAILRDLTAEEVGLGAATVALAGGGWWLSDDLTVLPAERKAWATQGPWPELALSGTPGHPEQPVPLAAPPMLAGALFDHLEGQSRHVVPVVWRQGSHRFALNVTDQALEVEGVQVPAHAVRELVGK